MMNDRNSKLETIRRYTPTRWTSFRDTHARILELWGPLAAFFDQETENRHTAAEKEKFYFTELKYKYCVFKYC